MPAFYVRRSGSKFDATNKESLNQSSAMRETTYQRFPDFWWRTLLPKTTYAIL
jgi:hypothetical protein